MKYLLDTNVVSELFKKQPEPKVVNWLAKTANEACYLSVLSIGEIRQGVEGMEHGQKKVKLIQFLEKDLEEQFEGRILTVDREVAKTWGLLEAQAGRTLPAVDAFLAATAIVHHLTLVTRNTRDFSFAGIKLFNPW